MDKNLPFQRININSKTSFYLMSFRYLNNFQPIIPTIQRSYVEERVDYFYNQLVNNFQKNNEIYNLNPIQLAELDSRYFILDGQHRYMAYFKLYQNYFLPYNTDFNITLINRECENYDELKKSFIELNNNFITKELILDLNNMDKSTILKEYIKENFPGHISNAEKPKFPNINLDNFVNLLLERFKKDNINTIIQKLNESNKDISQYLYENDIGNYQIIKNKGGLYMAYIIHKKNEPENKDGRKKLPAAVRRALFERDFGKETTKGVCFICNTDINIHNFHGGHIIASKNGGTDNIKNLQCVCGHCNLSMGTEDMIVFKNKYF